MAIPKTSLHVRSVSLPSPSQTLDASIEDHFRKLRSSQAGPSSSSSICQNLSCTKNLYEQMNYLIHLPHSQHALPHARYRQEVEEVLDGSLALLDVASLALDTLSQMKRSVLDLQSALRRGSTDEGIQAYAMSRKKLRKMVSKCLVNLNKAENHCPETNATTMTMLKEAEFISLSTLKSVLSFLMGKKAVSRTQGWSLVAKLVKSKRESGENTTEIEEVDRLLFSGTEMKVVQKQLKTIEMTIYELEDCLESVSKCFVKTRVSLLNVLNH